MNSFKAKSLRYPTLLGKPLIHHYNVQNRRIKVKQHKAKDSKNGDLCTRLEHLI
jgi:hypothetical protein